MASIRSSGAPSWASSSRLRTRLTVMGEMHRRIGRSPAGCNPPATTGLSRRPVRHGLPTVLPRCVYHAMLELSTSTSR